MRRLRSQNRLEPAMRFSVAACGNERRQFTRNVIRRSRFPAIHESSCPSAERPDRQSPRPSEEEIPQKIIREKVRGPGYSRPSRLHPAGGRRESVGVHGNVPAVACIAYDAMIL